MRNLPDNTDKIEIENILSPNHVVRVDKAKYTAMREALMKVMPPDAPGATAAELKAGLLQHLSEELFPGGAKAGWWLKAVQLDLEAKDVIKREATKPLRFHRI